MVWLILYIGVNLQREIVRTIDEYEELVSDKRKPMWKKAIAAFRKRQPLRTMLKGQVKDQSSKE
jgi:hypothetical protein